jgi:hypothetical protein
LDELPIEGSFWEKFSEQLQNHLESKETKFWPKGFEILQNINDRLTPEKEPKLAKDSIFLTTNNKKTDETKHQQEQSPKQNIETDILQMELNSR